MKLINKTLWNTAHLRAFVSRIAADELDAAGRKRLIITFVNSRKYLTGCARIGGRNARIRIPSDADQWKLSLASLIAHELAHIRGMKSGRSNERSMRGQESKYGRNVEVQRRAFPWAESMPLEPAAPKAKPVADPGNVAEAKAEHLRSLIGKWDAKRKRAETAMRKYRKRLRYYEKKIAACKPA